ncbi:MAG: MGMT family protein [Aquihabitans sp.]
MSEPLREARQEAAQQARPETGPLQPFEEAVAEVLTGLVPGDVVTYGEVAAEAGFPGAARAVGTLLGRSGGQFPWWRVVNATGRLVPGLEDEHATRLRAEGVPVTDGRVRGLHKRPNAS